MLPSDYVILGLIAAGVLIYNYLKSSGRRMLKKGDNISPQELNAASEMLKREGYRVLEVCPSIAFTTYVDGKPYQHLLQADFIVEKEGSRYTVLLESCGERLSSSRAKKRYLVYFLLFRPEAVIILNLEDGRWHFVSFELGTLLIKSPKRFLGYLAASALGAFLTWWFVQL